MKEKILEKAIKSHCAPTIFGAVQQEKISSVFGISRHEANKLIKELVSDGLLEEYTSSGFGGEYGEAYPPVRGYKITEKVINSDLFREVNEKVIHEYDFLPF